MSNFQAPAPRGRAPLLAGALTLAWTALVEVWLLKAGEPGRALRKLPAAERAALYERTMETLGRLCEPAPPRSLRAFCSEQAALVLELNECDGPCREIAWRNLTVPSR